MNQDLAVNFVREMLWMALLITGPILLSSLIVGLLISILQVVTQIQDISITFVPKIITIVLVIIALGPWMLSRLSNYSQQVIQSISGSVL